MGASLKSLYLFLYNASLVVGWTYVLYKTIVEWQANGPNGAFIACRKELEIAQTAAVLEVVHSATGVVRSPLVTTVLQVTSRIAILWGVLIAIPFDSRTAEVVLFASDDVKLALNTATMITAWSLSEIIRYSFYACKELGGVPYVVEWVRYSGFIVLYPIGVASELTMIYRGLPHMKGNGIYDLLMPNAINFSFVYYYALLLGTAVYIPGFPKLYFYMLAQRKKVLAKAKAKSS